MLQATDQARQMEALLDDTHVALLAGNFDALAPLGEAVDVLASSLGRVDSVTAARLRQKADRNGEMLQAAARGARAARSRIADITAEPALTTYDARGRKDSVGQVSWVPLRRF